MPRRKAAQNCTIAPWLSGRADCKEGRFIQIGNSLLLDKTFQALTAGARSLYLCMAMEAGGKANFEFPLAASKKYGISSSSLRRGIEELEAAGFIKVDRAGSHLMPRSQARNRYTFVTVWRMPSSSLVISSVTAASVTVEEGSI